MEATIKPTQVYTRTLGEISLNSLQKMNLFQGDGLSGCFATENAFTQDQLVTEDVSNRKLDIYKSSRNQLQTSRGFFDWLWGGITTVANFVVSTVVDVIEEGVKTVVGVANTIGKVVTGDFSGALDEIRNIPIVADIEASANSLVLPREF